MEKKNWMSINRWMDKEYAVPIHTMEYYSAIKKQWSFATTWIDLGAIMLNELSQREKDKYCMLSLLCGT